MKFKDIKLLVFFIFGVYLSGCGSGEYDLEQTQVEYIEKTLKYDTIETIVRDTVVNKQDLVNNSKNIKNEPFTFIVQIGAFREQNNFQRFYETAKSKLGDEVYNVVINDLNKIRIGSYNDKAEALKLLDYVKSLGYFNAFVLTVINK